MAPDSPRNHGNHVEVNYGTIHQHLGQPAAPPRPPQRRRLALLAGGAATVLLLGGWGVWAQGHRPVGKKAFYCTSGSAARYHAYPGCWGLRSCSARVVTLTLAKAQQRQLEPCQVCH